LAALAFAALTLAALALAALALAAVGALLCTGEAAGFGSAHRSLRRRLA
jgi:hypothetical protein